MATTTPKLGLIKPDLSDNVDIDNLNDNMDILDDALTDSSTLNDLSGVTLTSPVAGDSLVYNGTDWVNGPRSGNAIINGDFGIWQRGTSINVGDGGYGPDRWRRSSNGTGTYNFSRQTFTPGTAPVSGYEGEYFCRYQLTSPTAQSYNVIQQPIEDVRKFAGQTATFSMWAKTTSGTVSITPELHQFFGSGGSSDVIVTGSAWTATTSWQRFTVTFSVPSLSGKTIGAGNWVSIDLILPLNTALTVDIWGVQLEAGPVATPFIPAGGGSRAAELALCQRYYYRTAPLADGRIAAGYNVLTTTGHYIINFPVAMRIAPTALEQSGTATDYCIQHGNNITNLNSAPTYIQGSSTNGGTSAGVASGLTAGQGSLLRANNTNAYFAWSAEL